MALCETHSFVEKKTKVVEYEENVKKYTLTLSEDEAINLYETLGVLSFPYDDTSASNMTNIYNALHQKLPENVICKRSQYKIVMMSRRED